MLPPTHNQSITYLFSACKGVINMFNNIPREELIEFLIALADTFIHWAKWFLITGIVLAILGCAIFGLVVILRSREVNNVRKIKKPR